MHVRKLTATLAVMALLSGTAAGCKAEDGTRWRDATSAAYAKLNDMNTYTFDGTITLKLPAPSEAHNPVAGALTAALLSDSLTFSGSASKAPAYLDARLGLAPNSGSPTWTIPILLKDNKLYASLPLINKKDEWMSLDLQKLPGQSGKLDEAGQVLNRYLAAWTAAVQPELFRNLAESKQSPPLLELKLEGRQGAAALSELSRLWPTFIDELAAKTLISADQASSWKNVLHSDQLNGFSLTQPGYVRLKLNEQGYITEHQIKIDAERQRKDGRTEPLSIHYSMSYTEINGTMPAAKQPPTQLLPLEDVLRKLAPSTPKP